MRQATLGVMTPSGKRIGSHVVETNARCLVEAVRQIPQPRHIRLEEGTLSEWLYEVLSPHGEKVVVAAASESRGPKDDRRAGSWAHVVLEGEGRSALTEDYLRVGVTGPLPEDHRVIHDVELVMVDGELSAVLGTD